MRPAGEIRQAILQAAVDLIEEIRQSSKEGRKGPTLAEIAARAGVARRDARVCVSNCKRAGALQIVGEFRVPKRNRPAAEYAPVQRSDLFDKAPADSGAAVLGMFMQSWAR